MDTEELTFDRTVKSSGARVSTFCSHCFQYEAPELLNRSFHSSHQLNLTLRVPGTLLKEYIEKR